MRASPRLVPRSGPQPVVISVDAGRADPGVRFELPPHSHATTTPERRGLRRDQVRLMVAAPGTVGHHRFDELPDLLEPGDLVVLNTSATMPAAVDGRGDDGQPVTVHVSTQLDDGDWVVEPRLAGGSRRDASDRSGQAIRLPGGLRLRLHASYPDPIGTDHRLWRATPCPHEAAAAYLPGHGRPVEYGYLAGRHSLADHQTVYASRAGSAEMPSAGRPFSTETLVRLMSRGITVTPLLLHAGLSSQEAHEPPLPEYFEVPPVTARLVGGARAAGRRVVAVGTTVVRALETVTGEDGRVQAGSGWTGLVLGPGRPARVVTGLITGLHEPQASHLALLQAVAGQALVQAGYDAVVSAGYLWHEFGDSMLLLP
jgi:S-adenosylmethionine:tRNA ribosyltransferase-isomerase